MKKQFFLLILCFALFTVQAQETATKSKKQIKAAERVKKAEETDRLLNSRNFVFRARQASPIGGGNIQLDFYFDAAIRGDTLVSYLPFYGVAYRADYASRQSPFHFTQPMENYRMEKDKKGYLIHAEVKNGMDYLTYTFRVSESGYASLTVTSTNRQTISYTGVVEPAGEDRKGKATL
jgi:hypothetical protein